MSIFDLGHELLKPPDLKFYPIPLRKVMKKSNPRCAQTEKSNPLTPRPRRSENSNPLISAGEQDHVSLRSTLGNVFPFAASKETDNKNIAELFLSARAKKPRTLRHPRSWSTENFEPSRRHARKSQTLRLPRLLTAAAHQKLEPSHPCALGCVFPLTADEEAN